MKADAETRWVWTCKNTPTENRWNSEGICQNRQIVFLNMFHQHNNSAIHSSSLKLSSENSSQFSYGNSGFFRRIQVVKNRKFVCVYDSFDTGNKLDITLTKCKVIENFCHGLWICHQLCESSSGAASRFRALCLRMVTCCRDHNLKPF